MPFDPESKVTYKNLKKIYDQCGSQPVALAGVVGEWLTNNAPADQVAPLHRDDQRRLDRMEHSQKRKEIAAAAAANRTSTQPVPPEVTADPGGESGEVAKP